jgi:hypothetical protein
MEIDRSVTLERYRDTAEQLYRERAGAFYKALEAKGINTSVENCESIRMFDAYFTTEFS